MDNRKLAKELLVLAREINAAAKKSKKVTTIEDDTPIMPGIIADTVFDEHTIGTGWGRGSAIDIAGIPRGTNMGEYFSKVSDAEYTKMRDLFSDFVTKKANSVYRANKDWQKKMNAAGDVGRDFLYSFVHHWADGFVKAYATKKLPQFLQQFAGMATP